MSWNIHKCVYEHRRYIRVRNDALLQHISMSNHKFDFNAETVFVLIYNFETNFRSRCNFDFSIS